MTRAPTILAALLLAAAELVSADCTLGAWCADGTPGCAADPCHDHLRDGDETDLDCGGSCGPCGPGAACAVPADCGEDRHRRVRQYERRRRGRRRAEHDHRHRPPGHDHRHRRQHRHRHLVRYDRPERPGLLPNERLQRHLRLRRLRQADGGRVRGRELRPRRRRLRAACGSDYTGSFCVTGKKMTGCIMNGSHCDFDEDCCSGSCFTGDNTCEDMGTCNNSGAPCSFDDDCCSNSCGDDGTCE